MLVSSALGKVAPFVPVVGSAYGFGKTCIEVYFIALLAYLEPLWRE